MNRNPQPWLVAGKRDNDSDSGSKHGGKGSDEGGKSGSGDNQGKK